MPVVGRKISGKPAKPVPFKLTITGFGVQFGQVLHGNVGLLVGT
jgi:hypothetical protein